MEVMLLARDEEVHLVRGLDFRLSFATHVQASSFFHFLASPTCLAALHYSYAMVLTVPSCLHLHLPGPVRITAPCSPSPIRPASPV